MNSEQIDIIAMNAVSIQHGTGYLFGYNELSDNQADMHYAITSEMNQMNIDGKSKEDIESLVYSYDYLKKFS